MCNQELLVGMTVVTRAQGGGAGGGGHTCRCGGANGHGQCRCGANVMVSIPKDGCNGFLYLSNAFTVLAVDGGDVWLKRSNGSKVTMRRDMVQPV